ncbi:MAG: zinc-binding dehydrogenase [Xanthomonadales bacterium]|nr:zinc-binding dehydrogenase [Xanthomonadales bacterium]
MRAAFYEETGAAADVLRVGEIDDPVPGDGEVLVRVHVHGVNPTDCKRRAGQRGRLPFPRVIPGYDGAGVIEAVGAGVDPSRVGQRVWLWEAAHQKWDGAAAELVRLPASRAMPLPDGASFADGASLGVPAITACHALMLGGPLVGETVIVTGAAGAVCNYAVQLAKRMGATVIGTVRGEDDRSQDARHAGADHVVNTDRESFKEVALDLTDGKGVRTMIDVDLGAHLDYAWRIVAQNGTIASFGSASNPAPVIDWPKFMYRNIRLNGVAIFEVPEAAKQRAVAFVQESLEAGDFWHREDSRYLLDAIAEAHERQETGRPRGKVLVKIG